MCNGKCGPEDTTFDIADDLTEDIQFDLAMVIASNRSGFLLDIDERMIAEMTADLKRRGAPLPINCRWESSPYARFGKKLYYDLEEQHIVPTIGVSDAIS